jgi:uncharacterized protein (DUF433 family)
MIFEVATEQPPLRVEADGTVRIGHTRVTLDTLVASYRNGNTAEQIAQQYPPLSLAEIYAVIGYYLSHPEQVAKYLQERERAAGEMRRQIESDPVTQQIRARLNARVSTAGPSTE